MPGWVKLVLAEDYRERVEVRVWPHSGFQPGALDPDVSLFKRLPFIADRQKYWHPPGVRRGPELFVGGIEVPMAWYFQVRLVAGDGLVSEPSNAWFEIFWQVPEDQEWVKWIEGSGG